MDDSIKTIFFNPDNIEYFKETINFWKNKIIFFAQYIVHFDQQIKQRAMMAWNSVNDSQYSHYAIWIPIISLAAAVAFFLFKFPEFRAIMRARNCKVEIEWNRNFPNRVGGEVVVKIMPFLSPTRLHIFDFPDTETANDLISNIVMQVFLEEEEITVNKSINQSDQAIYAKFPVLKSGKYSIYLSYCGFSVNGSPFTANMDADDMDITKSYVGVTNPLIIVENEIFRIDVIPLDMFHNRCATTLDTMQRIKFTVKKVDEFKAEVNAGHFSAARGPNVEGMGNQWSNPCLTTIDGNDNCDEDDDSDPTDFKTNVGIRRENPDLPEFLPLYCIYGKCKNVGEYSGQVIINDLFPLTLPAQTIELMCISTQEQDKVLDLKKQELCKFAVRLILEIPVPLPSNSNINTEDVGVLDVSLEMTNRFVFLSRRLFNGPMEKRLQTWRLGENISVEIVSIQNDPEPDTHIIKISDTQHHNSFKELVMTGFDARVFFVMFHEYLAAKKNDSHFKSILHPESRHFENNLREKQQAFYEQIRETFDIDELSLVLPSCRTFTVTRADIVKTTLDATKNFTRSDWGQPFVVSFRHEAVNRSGATWVEWAGELCKELFDSTAYGMFLGRNFTVGNRPQPGLLHPNHARNNHWKLQHYELAGKLVGKCVIENVLNPEHQFFVDARFSRTIFCMILGIWPSYKHLQVDDPDYFRTNCDTLLHNDVSHMKLNFEVRVVNDKGIFETLPLIPDGENIAVTNENKIRYLNALARYHLCHDVKKEIDAFISGLNFIIPGRLFMMFDENELELMLCGSTPLNFGNLIQYYHESPDKWNPSFNKLKNWLRKALEEMDAFDLGRFYQFLTGSSRLPREGFVALRPSISMSALFGQPPTGNRAQCHLTVSDHKSYQDFLNSLLDSIRKQEFD
ncbi:Apoptosis-resistant E3 ubiquitin protein ligase 1 [Folsomia candida]|uniref:HECT-type E3 ubiquitin transferase n=1 Tax=Folsomia candida TaxID=158441 RepID=A0A226DQQ8_FOLCA|nr:Apoptosis-resistant E3 ubiquitin protein ligase 1 [Folsomia candida]